MILRDLDDIVDRHSKCEIPFRKEKVAVAMFDLTNSTGMKLDKGQEYGICAAVMHNDICKSIASKFDGILIKEIGDEVLIVFSDPLNALHTSVNIKKAFQKQDLEISSKGAVTWGEVDFVRISGKSDVMGTVVDLCARIIRCATSDQFFIDSSLYQQTAININKNEIQISSRKLQIKNFGCVKCYEIVRLNSS